MMPEISLAYHPPLNDDDFDRLSCRVLSRHWSIPDLTRHGRNGQRQNGVDFYGETDRGKLYAGQSKLRTAPATLTVVEVRAEIEDAKTFRPTLAHFAIVTSARRDAHLQLLEREINREHRKARLFSVKIFFWDDILDLLQEYPDLRDAIYGGVSSSQVGEIKAFLGNSIRQRDAGLCDGQFHAEIDEAVQSIRKCDWRLARTLLTRMRERQWHTYGAIEKFRVLANLGHTYEHEGHYAAAANYFLQAAAELPDDERAIVRTICAHSYLGNRNLAHRLASELKAAHPENSDGYSLWIRTSSENVPFAELEESVPVHLRQEANIAFELSCRALSEHRFDEAEQYARAGFAKEPDDPLVLAQLGVTLIVREVRQNFVDAQFIATEKSSDNLTEAIAKITDAINSPKYEANFSAKVDLHLKRAIAHDLLGDHTQRQADIVQAHSLEPHNVEASVKYAVLLDEQGKSNDAIQLLEEIVSGTPAEGPSLLLAQLLAVRNAPTDREKALGIVEQVVGRISATSDHYGQIIEFFVRLSITTGMPKRSEEFLNRAGKSRVSNSLFHVLIGRIRFAANNREAAKACAMAALEAVDSRTSRFDRLQLGWLLHSLQEYQQVVDTLRDVVKPNVLNDDTIRLLESAQKSDEHEFILQFCDGLRSAGIFDRQCIDLELGVLHQLQCLSSAIQIIVDLISKVGDDNFRRELIVRRSIIGIEVDNPQLIETDPSQLPSVETADPALGRMTVVLIHRGAQAQKGVEYAYELVRRHFNAPEARMAVVASFGFATGEARIDLPTYVWAQPGTAVGFQENGSNKIEWRIIEDSPSPKAEFGELSPDHALVHELIGKRVGDEFFLRKNSVQDRLATVCEIVPKYVYRLRECLDSWEERYPNQFFVQQIHVKQTPDGQPDLSPIFNSVDQRIRQTQTVDSLYRDNPISLFAVAEAHGESVISTMMHLASQQGLGIKCCQFSESDLQILQKLPLTQRIVLDPSALATLFLSDMFDKLILPNGLWMITEATHREISRWRGKLREHKAEGGFITKVDGRHVVVPHDAFDHTRIIERFERFEAVIEDRMMIERGDDILRCGNALRQQLVSWFGPECAQSVATAMRPGHLLWTDDLVVAIVASESINCSRVWTQGVAGWLAESGQIKSDIYDELSLRLIESSYSYTLISSSVVLLAAKKSNWNGRNSRSAHGSVLAFNELCCVLAEG